MNIAAALLFSLAIGFGPYMSVEASATRHSNAKSTFEKFDRLIAHPGRRMKRQVEEPTLLEVTNNYQNFSSPTDGMGSYENGVHHVWMIIAPENMGVALFFTRFSVEGISGCMFDSLTVNDTFEVIDVFCGVGPNCTGNFPTREIVTQSNIMIITFETDVGITYPGFVAQYKYVDPGYEAKDHIQMNFTTSCTHSYNTTTNHTIAGKMPPLVTNCSENLVTSNEIDDVKRLVFNYTNNMHCTWNITTPRQTGRRTRRQIASQIRPAVRFVTFSVEGVSGCPYDYVRINNSYGELKLCGQGVTCSGNFPTRIYVSRSNSLLVSFVSDSSVVLGGFILEYYSVGPPYTGGNFTTREKANNSCRNEETAAGNRTVVTSVVNNTSILQANCSANHTATSTFTRMSLVSGRLYHNYARCANYFTAPFGKVVNLRFLRFDIEFGTGCTFDRVLVYTSTGPRPPIRLCGNNSNCHPTFPTREIVSDGNVLLVMFESDASISGTGYEAEFRFEDPGYVGQSFETAGSSTNSTCVQGTNNPPALPPPRPPTNRPCGGELTATTEIQRLRSPTIDDSTRNYPNDADCTWIIHGPPETLVMLSFDSFILEDATNCNYDRLEIKDSRRQLIAILCGQRFGCPGNYPQMELLSDANYMMLKFKSDESVNFSGFNATFQAVDPIYMPRDISMEVVGNRTARCNNTVSLPPTVAPPARHNDNFRRNLTAIGRPSTLFSHNTSRSTNYADNSRHIWIITAPQGMRVLVRIVSFELEGDTLCGYDSLGLSNGGDSVDVKFCGNGYFCIGNFPKAEWMSSSNKVYVIFTTDSSINFSGFELKYLAVDPSYEPQPHIAKENKTKTDRTCNMCARNRVNLTTENQINVPRVQTAEFYPSNLTCMWMLNTTSPNSLVNLTILTYDIEESADCSQDALIIQTSEDQEKKKYCGKSNEPLRFVTEGPVYVDFKSDLEGSGAGFKAIFKIVHQEDLSVTSEDNTQDQGEEVLLSGDDISV